MKGIFTILFILLLVSCKESGVQLAKPSTFVRYFNGGYNDQAQTVIETSDKGFLILANSLTKTTLTNTFYKIKLIKTDSYGNQQWEQFFPNYELDSKGIPLDPVLSYKGYGLTAIKDNSGSDTGYMITGSKINNTTTDSLLMIQIDKDFSASSPKPLLRVYYQLPVDVQGAAVAWSKTSGDFFVVGQIPSGATVGDNSMFFGQIDKTSLDFKWSKILRDGKSTLTNSLFLDYSEQSAYWGGTVNYNTGGGSLIRYVNSGFTSQTVGFNEPIGDALKYNYTGSDLCPYGFGYAFVGGRGDLGDTQYNTINYTLLSASGRLQKSVNFSIDSLTDHVITKQAIQPANSISSTADGGLLLLCTLAVDAQATNTDYYLLKIDVAGRPQWLRQQGGKFVDVGAKVIQASDGGFIVLGTTTLANVQSILLMKTDSDGNIQ